MPSSTPGAARAVLLRSYGAGFDKLEIAERPVSPPAARDLTIAISAAPVHPADLAFIQGRYGVRKPLPTVPGFEAAGVVVAAGSQADPSWIGRRVCFMASEFDGTWAEYTHTHEANCFSTPDGLDDDLASMLLINPLTAWALVDRARASGTQGIIQTAAASALGKMIIRLCSRAGIETINVVRRESAIPELQAAGARYILNSEEPTFDRHLRQLTRAIPTLLAFDAVGGALSGRILRALQAGGELVMVGVLDSTPVTLSADQLIFRSRRVSGFWLAHWLRSAGAETRARAWDDVREHFADYETHVAARCGLEQSRQAIADYAANMTRGKVLITPRR